MLIRQNKEHHDSFKESLETLENSQERELTEELVKQFMKFSAYDQVYREKKSIEEVVECYETNIPKKICIRYIISLVERSLNILKECKDLYPNSLKFSAEAFNKCSIVIRAEGDFYSPDTVIDVKVDKLEIPSLESKLQVICYGLLHKIEFPYGNMSNLVIYNPRYDNTYSCKLSNIPKTTISYILKNIMGFSGTYEDLFN